MFEIISTLIDCSKRLSGNSNFLFFSMLAQQILIDGVDILRNGIHYTHTNWLELQVSDESRDIQGTHGRDVSPTFARTRVITLEGIVDRRVNDYDAINHLRYLFRLQWLSEAVDVRTVSVFDAYWTKWNIRTKIKEPLDIQEGDEETWVWEYWKWRVVLESIWWPEYRSEFEVRYPASGYGKEGLYGGMRLGTKLGTPFNESMASIEVISSNNADTPIRLVIECVDSGNPNSGVQSPLIVNNLSTGSQFKLDVSMVPGDTIVIDSPNLKVYKNDNDITLSRLPGSVFPSVYGSTKFSVVDYDGYMVSDDVRVSAYFYNTLL